MSYSRSRQVRVVVFCLFSAGILSLVRLVSLVWNYSQFRAVSAADLGLVFLYGFRFDLVASAWLSLPLLVWSCVPTPAARERLWRRVALAVSLALFVPFLLLNLVDAEFVNFVGRRMTADVLFLLGEAQGKTQGYLWFYKWLNLMAAVVVALQLGGTFWIWRRPLSLTERSRRDLAWTFALILVFFIAVRGGVQSKPISFVDARKFDSTALNNLVLNTTFNLLKNLAQEQLPRVRYFAARDAMLAHLNGAVAAPSLLDGRRPAAGNVVILILESFGLEYTGIPAGNQSWTPFLDSLAKEGLSFDLAIANGRRSIEGVAAVLSGIPALMNEPFISSSFSANEFIGLGSQLSRQGYDTAFFHGGKNGTMRFDAFTRSAGIKKYLGADEYPNAADHDGVWGIYDGPFMQWTVKQLSAMRSPFFATLFSISSHQPYLIPPAERALYAEGAIPILKTVAYADASLRKFFEAARRQPWFKDTLFVITGDHTFLPPNDRWNHELGRWRIPMVFYREGMDWPAGIDRAAPVQQIDVPASVMDFLGFEMPRQVLLSRSVFVPGERTAVTYADGTYLLVAKDFLLHQNSGEPTRLFAIADPRMKTLLESPMREALEKRLKATIQYFSEGMWDNRLYAPVPRKTDSGAVGPAPGH
jgi:phosphoglycerol transferase MdoB-like AlkP superfamily enzyme